MSVILDHQNIGVDTKFSVLSCLVQEIWWKLHDTVRMENKMADMATMGRLYTWKFCTMYNCTTFNAFVKTEQFFFTHHLENSSPILKCHWIHHEQLWELNRVFWIGSELATSYERPCRRVNFKIWCGMCWNVLFFWTLKCLVFCVSEGNSCRSVVN